MVHGEFLEYSDGAQTCEAYLAHDGRDAAPRPCVVVVHAWDGQNEAVRVRTRQLAADGRVGFALDLYGEGVRGEETGDNTRLMAPLLADRGLLRARLSAGVEAARRHPRVDPERIVVLGYCFGGLCALDVARSGAPGVRGVVSVHGLLTPPAGLAPGPIAAKVLILHGWEDPVAPPQDVLAVARELTLAGADWQLRAYGHAMHAFTLVGADLPGRGIRHDPLAERRAARAVVEFLDEVLGPVDA